MITTDQDQTDSLPDGRLPSWREVFLYFLFLGFVNIGGPVAQITMMFNHMVEKAPVAIEGSIRQDHGFLSHASGQKPCSWRSTSVI